MTPPDDSPTLSEPVGPRDHAQGPETAPVTLVEYGDFECPHCARAYRVIKSLQQRMGERLRFVFRYFPLRQTHPHAESAAEAAESAAVMGKFWEMHDTLFENQDSLEPSDLLSYAEVLELDSERVAEELRTGVHAPRVQEDFLSGIRSGVNATPTFFINGRRYDDSWEEEVLLAALEEAARTKPRAARRTKKTG